ncbi:lysine transporter LysE [Marinobacterium zhoushanense]|uniref:Lysine transporter LysE n=1 Tax=Marinobacterium zhoushanense TaxID=1679163 RepID=A0ABQ1K3I5_9GAMM|nr:LysE family transporter [Marinobacterium zhoushanense]GGB82822.1 lysine transporter LysE [Marinobacterium zhoushanense]
MDIAYLHEFTALALVHFLAVVIPGPDFAITVRQSVRFGHLAGTVTALGIGAGISVHVIYTLLGISALMHTTPWLMDMASLVGGVYLIYLGVGLIRSRPARADALAAEAGAQQSPPLHRAFMVGFMTNATNPKATLFFLAIFTTLVSGTTPLPVQILYGSWMCVVNATWFILVSYMFSRNGVRSRFLCLGHWLERTMGGLLIGVALIYFERLGHSVFDEWLSAVV